MTPAEQKVQNTDDGNEIVDQVEIGKNAEQGPARIAVFRASDPPQKPGPRHGQKDQGHIEKPGSGKDIVPFSALQVSPGKMPGEEEPDIGQSDIDQIKQEIKDNEGAAPEILPCIDDDPQTVHCHIEHAGPDQDKGNSPVLTFFQLVTDIKQHEGQPDKQQRCSHGICDRHVLLLPRGCADQRGIRQISCGFLLLPF